NDVSAQKPLLVFAAASLHGWYTAVESMFERVAREFDHRIPKGERRHRDLLEQMTLEIPGVRRPVIEKALERELSELLKFRHFFRHAYNVELDAGKVLTEARRMLA